MDIHPNEMGDIGPALSLLLLAQAGYSRGDQAYSRGMRDVAEKALIREINAYIEWRVNSSVARIEVQNAILGDGAPH